jgi:hypothetical protein
MSGQAASLRRTVAPWTPPLVHSTMRTLECVQLLGENRDGVPDVFLGVTAADEEA